jgi:flagellar biosynthesis protein FlhA
MPDDNTLGASTLARFSQYSHLLIAVIVALVVTMLIIPLPVALLDILLALNITLSALVLLITMYANETLHFSVFPTLLLVSTLFRLGLYIAATRLILSQASAGGIINAFGSIIISGNYVVGIVIFIILAIVQYIVITNGTTRISEVAARFTLDAMPGKQMSIDADLNSGLITEEEAKQRRQNIEREADFYGAMDGASKFIKGDALASIIITTVNLIGGIIIGALQLNMDIMTSMQTFGRLAVGAGIVIQIPALLLSSSAGFIVTRVASEGNLGEDLASQLLIKPRAIAVAAGLMALLGLLPGLPKLPFFAMAAIAALGAYVISQSSQEEAAALEEEKERMKEEAKQKAPESFYDVLQVDAIELEIGYALIPLVDPDQGGELLDRITLMRRQVALDLGYVVPPIRIRDNIQLLPNNYNINIKGVPITKGEIIIDQYLAIDSGMAKDKVDGIPTKEPAFGLPAIWILESQKERAEISGYTVVDPCSAVITHLSEIIKNYASELLGRQDVQEMLDNIKQKYPVIIDELIPNLMTVGEIQRVLQSLLRERVSIRDMVTILEVLGDYAASTKDIDFLTERVRQGLARNICRQYQNEAGQLHVLTIDPQLEKEIADAIDRSDHGSSIAIDPNKVQQILSNLSQNLEPMVSQGKSPVILSSPNVRLPFKKLTERAVPNLVVLSYGEVPPEVDLQAQGMVSVA